MVHNTNLIVLWTTQYKSLLFNLEECMNNEFLRPRENRCKWFNNLGVMRRSVYIYLGGRCKNSAKSNIVNQFRNQEEKPDGLWWLIWSRHNLNRFKMPRMNIETIQANLTRFKMSWNDSPQVRDFGWYDSGKSESIQILRKSILTTMMRLLES